MRKIKLIITPIELIINDDLFIPKLLNILINKVLKKECLGGGDIKMMFVFGLILTDEDFAIIVGLLTSFHIAYNIVSSSKAIFSPAFTCWPTFTNNFCECA